MSTARFSIRGRDLFAERAREDCPLIVDLVMFLRDVMEALLPQDVVERL